MLGLFTKRAFLVLVPIIVAIAGSLFYIGYSKRNLNGPVTISINSLYSNSPVFINNSLVGNTPYKGQKTVSDPLSISIKSENSIYETALRPSPGTEISIKRDLGSSKKFSSGQTVYIDKSNLKTPAVSITTTPNNVMVSVNGINVGKSPILLSDPATLIPDKECKIEVSLQNYEGQSLTVVPKSGYTANVIFDLGLLPLKENPKELPESLEDYKLFSIVNPEIYLSTTKEEWIKAINYYKKTRGVGLPEFGFFVDEDGIIYDATKGTPYAKKQEDLPKPPVIVGILRSEDGVLSEKIASGIATAFGKAQKVEKTATVLETGTDFGLNVRSGAGVNFEKVGQIKVGTTVVILEVQGSWTKIRFDKTKEGFVSSSYLSSK
jgi:hypothetical protein